MLSYRHSFHAGNSADVIKHAVLVFCLKYLTQKQKPLLCIDTHAGAGAYRLDECGEWKNGTGRLLAIADKSAMPAPVSEYLDLANEENGIYPGSPLLMGKLLRKQDRLVCFELHPQDFLKLENAMNTRRGGFSQNGDSCVNASGNFLPKIETRNEDGPLSLKSLLPPLSGRGLVLVDPSWEEKDEYKNIPQILSNALARFSQGTYIVWYPVLKKPKTFLPDSESIGETLFRLYNGNRCRLEVYNPMAETGIHSPRGMSGSGLVIYNPPWTLNPALNEMLPFLAENLAEKGKWNLEWNNK